MIKIKKLLKEIDEDENSNIASIEDEREWKWPDVDHMFSMKFERVGESLFVLNNPPIKVYKIKRGPFILEEPEENHKYQDFKKGMQAPMKSQGISAFNKNTKIQKYSFDSFNELIEFFDKYEQ